MNKVFIFEDNTADWRVECDILKDVYEYYPKEVDEYNEVRNCFRRIQNENKKLRDESKRRLKEIINIQKPDLYIMDYALKTLRDTVIVNIPLSV